MRFKARPSLLLLTCATLLAAGPSSHGASSWKPQGRIDDLDKFKAGKQEPMQPGNITVKNKDGTYMNQGDAFELASEHAVYAQAYQLMYGPYGYGEKDSPNTNRKAALKKTAQAIEDCLANVGCDSKKQELVLKALVQYNYGQELKRIALVNNTNREKMRTVKEMDPDKIWKSLQQGSVTRAGRKEKQAMQIQGGISKEPYFQLGSVGGVRPDAVEKLGPEFQKEYTQFVKDYTSASRGPKGRYYKYVEARTRPGVYVYDPAAPNQLKDSARLAEVERDQNNENIQKLVANHLEGLEAPSVKKEVIDGKEVATVAGNTGKKVGLGETSRVFVPTADGKGTEEITDYKKYQYLVGKLDGAFKETAEKKLSAEDKAFIASRKIANATGASLAPGEPTPKEMADRMLNVNVTLSPERFDSFLDEIWPTSAERRKRLAEPTDQGNAPAGGTTRTN